MVSIGVYAVTALLLTEIMTLVNSTMKATNQLNRRLAYEAKFADNLLLSDGIDTWENLTPDDGSGGPAGKKAVTISLTVQDTGSTDEDIRNGYSVSPAASGHVYMTSAKNMERKNGLKDDNVLINKGTNYRFMVFTKESATLPNQPDSFDITLNLQRDAAHSAQPIPTPVSKIILKDNPMFKFGENSGAIFTEQTITQRDAYVDSSDATRSDANPVKDPNLEGRRSSGSELFTISIPTKDSDGNSLSQQGSLTVMLFAGVKDTDGHEYLWFNNDDHSALSADFKAFADDATTEAELAMVRSLDNSYFPSTQRITLEYNMYEHNSLTDTYTYFTGVTYNWNYDTGEVTCNQVGG